MDKYDDIYNILLARFPGPKCFLNHKNNFELLCAVMMSAQTKDERVNAVSVELFDKYSTPSLMANADINDIIRIIKPIGMANNKAKNLINLSKLLVEKFDSIVPSDYDDLLLFPGVARKTANVVRAVGFNIPAIAVDTHVLRVSKRLGFIGEDEKELACENKLMTLFPRDRWIDIHHLLILFGRNYCDAKKPLCDSCILKQYCKMGK